MMMLFISGTQPFQHFYSRKFIGLIYLQHFKSSAESLFRFYQFTIFVNSRGSDNGNLPSGKFGLQQVTDTATDGSFTVNQGMNFVYEQYRFVKLFDLF